MQDPTYAPPHPRPLSPIAALLRTIAQGDGDLLSLLPADAYRREVTDLGYSRRSIVLFNEPELVRQILADADGIFPKNDLMVDALEPLIGQSIFVTDGELWRRQRAMIEPAFTHMRIALAYGSMQEAVNAFAGRLERKAREGERFSIDRAMSELTADIICRTVFSVPLDSGVSHEVFEDFAVFERAVAQVNLSKLIFAPAWSKMRQPERVLAACRRIRRHLGAMIDTHLGDGAARFNDIASSVIAARDPETNKPLTREELIDQLGVFFLAGHETTASVLTWVFFMLGVQPTLARAIRDEVLAIAPHGDISLEQTRRMPLLRAVFKETLRLYPPVTFIPRVALETTTVGPRRLKRGAMVMVSPWAMHRNSRLWQHPHAFDAGRFLAERESAIPKGAYIPFGAGRHTCIGSAFAHAESALIIARLARDFDFMVLDPRTVRPAARLTTRPASEIIARTRHVPPPGR